MAKTLYSLMLSEDVVREVDKLAHRMGATRSGLINSILAEYVGFVTPEQRINNILSEVERLLSPATDLVPFLAPGAMSLSLKSALEYKYRPTVKYEVQLYKGDSSAIGELNVVFRTQSAGLLAAMADFFRLWKRTEDAFLPPAGVHVDYALYEGKFTRSIALPTHNTDAETLANALSAYIRLFDSCMKGCLGGRYGEADVRAAYLSYLDEVGMYL